MTIHIKIIHKEFEVHPLPQRVICLPGYKPPKQKKKPPHLLFKQAASFTVIENAKIESKTLTVFLLDKILEGKYIVVDDSGNPKIFVERLHNRQPHYGFVCDIPGTRDSIQQGLIRVIPLSKIGKNEKSNTEEKNDVNEEITREKIKKFMFSFYNLRKAREKISKKKRRKSHYYF